MAPRAVVHHHDLTPDALAQQRLQQPPQRRPAGARDHHVHHYASASSGARRAASGRGGRRTTNGPIASRSTGAEPKHSSASRGSSTIGRPAVLRLVFTTTGTPVRRSKPSSIRATSGSASRSTV